MHMYTLYSVRVPVDNIQHSDEVIIFEVGHVKSQDIWPDLLLDILANMERQKYNILKSKNTCTCFYVHVHVQCTVYVYIRTCQTQYSVDSV